MLLPMICTEKVKFKHFLEEIKYIWKTETIMNNFHQNNQLGLILY